MCNVENFIYICKVNLQKSYRVEAILNTTYEQVLSLVRQLPRQQKIGLTEELNKDSIGAQLSLLLNAFRTDVLSLDTLDEEVELYVNSYMIAKNEKTLLKQI